MERCGTLILLRHGKSAWNEKNLFTGWVDVPLTQNGILEAQKAGEKIASISFDMIFVSSLIRAQMTAMIAMSLSKSPKTPVIYHPEGDRLGEWGKIYDAESLKETIPVYIASELNERMYGELQGLDKEKTRKQYGEEQVHMWRRSYDLPPPKGESLEMTAQRTLPYFKQAILPHLHEGKQLLVAAHGNSLRSIVMFLDRLSPQEVLELEIPTGEPIRYTVKNGSAQKQEWS